MAFLYQLLVIVLLLSARVLSHQDTVQRPEAIDKRTTGDDGEPEEMSGSVQTQISQLYQIYKATQNNIIQLNTEISLINEQLTYLRGAIKATKQEIKNDVTVELTAATESLKLETMNNSSRLAHTLFEQFVGLEHATSFSINATGVNIARIQSSVDTLTAAGDTAATQLSSLQSVVNGLNTAQHTVTTQLSRLQSSMTSLTTRVNTPVNLYQNCTRESKSCNREAVSSSFLTYCFTDSLPINVTGYYTLDISCKYDQRPGYLNTATLIPGVGQTNFVRCFCHTLRITFDRGHYIRGSFNESACTMAAIRCPLSQTIL